LVVGEKLSTVSVYKLRIYPKHVIDAFAVNEFQFRPSILIVTI